MLRVDLNCDMGEGYGNDAELMNHITSANIACGYHAGDPDTMLRTALLAVEHGVRIGAHPGYPDRETFGRTAMSMSPKKVHALVTEQIQAMMATAEKAGGHVSHVKPHGALYNQAAQDVELADAIAEAVSDCGPDLVLYGLSGSVSISRAIETGLRTASEVFADRTYQTNGSLTPRKEATALINNAGKAATQALDMVKYGRVRSVDAVMIKIAADTICVHGDTPNALTFVQTIRSALETNGVTIAPI